MSAVSFTHEPEARRGLICFQTTGLEFEDSWSYTYSGELSVRLSDRELIELYRALRSEIGEHVREMEAAYAQYQRERFDVREDDDEWVMLDPSDPKHPGYHDAVADWADDQRKRMKEGDA